MICRTDFGTYDVDIFVSRYCDNGNLAIQLISPTEGPFATITVNLSAGQLPEDCAFVDTNNCPWAPDFIAEHGLGRCTCMIGASGYCTYPMYEFDVDKLDNLNREREGR